MKSHTSTHTKISQFADTTHTQAPLLPPEQLINSSFTHIHYRQLTNQGQDKCQKPQKRVQNTVKAGQDIWATARRKGQEKGGAEQWGTHNVSQVVTVSKAQQQDQTNERTLEERVQEE